MASQPQASRGKDSQTVHNALWRVTKGRLSPDQRTQQYTARKRAKGKTSRGALRCLKRFITRDIYRILTDPQPVISTRDLCPARLTLGFAMQAATDDFGVALNAISLTKHGVNANREFAQQYQT